MLDPEYKITVPKLALIELKKDLRKAIFECSIRGLKHSVKWMAELNHSLSHVTLEPSFRINVDKNMFADEYDKYFLAKGYFDQMEFERCTAATENSKTDICRFLHYYSQYLSVEKKKIEQMSEEWPDAKDNSGLQGLMRELSKEYRLKKLDAYMLYLYGVVLKRRELNEEAMEVLMEAILKEPLHWGAWVELASLIPDNETLKELKFPDHWIKNFFFGHSFLELQLNDEALHIYRQLQSQAFGQSIYLLAQTAIAYHNIRDVPKAISAFNEIKSLDPHRLENLDTFSNLLYVREMREELADLAEHAVGIDKHRAETCCIIGNYYSLRSEHQKAVLYFQKALRINPYYLSAWTLMGHEFMELKNTNAAIQSYRHAIDVNRRDYRAWYGLGQTYEILKLSYFCLYYYSQAQRLKPNDSRMLVALGETYEKLDKVHEAVLCYKRARAVGDIDGTSAYKLARIYEKQQQMGDALRMYMEFVDDVKDLSSSEYRSDLAHTCKFLTNQYIKDNNLEFALQFAQMVHNFVETKDDGKLLLKIINSKKAALVGDMSMLPEDSTSSTSQMPRSIVFSPENPNVDEQ